MSTLMHGVFLACLFGGFAATLLFAALGALGGAAGHLHTGSPSAHTHAGHLPPAGPAHGQALSTGAPHSHALPSPGPHGHALPAHGAHGHAATHNSTSHTMAADRLGAAVGWTLSWLSPLTLAAGALWFGGVGLIAEGVLPHGFTLVAVVIALVAGLLGAVLVRALLRAFVRASTPPLQSDAVGAVGTINAPIRADALGEVVYTLEGLSRSCAARSVDGTPLPRGANVVIVRRERGVAWVEPLDPLAPFGGASTSAGTPATSEEVARRGDLTPP